MIEAEGEIEGRVAVPGAFGIEEDRAMRPGHDVLGADVAMDQGQLRRRRPVGQSFELRGKRRVTPSGGAEIRLEPQRLEQRAGREHRRDCRIAGGGAVDRREPLADRGREAEIDAARHQLRLPQAVGRGVEPFHDEEHRLVVMGDDAWRRTRHPRRRHLVPLALVAIALDRREPVVLDGELRHRPLDAEDAAASGHLPDVGGDAACEPLRHDRRAGLGKAEADKTREDIVGTHAVNNRATALILRRETAARSPGPERRSRARWR